ncbi:glucosylceramide transporter ABCA12-like [Lampetra fluviatilis]
MLDVTDVVGMTVQQTLGWPSMDQLVNGLHWIISTINQQNTTSFTSKCEDIFSVPNVTLWVNAPVPWRGLISEMIVFKNNAMANDELIPRMSLNNTLNILKSISGVLNIALSTSNSTTDGEVALIKAVLSLLRVFGEERIYNGTLTADTAEGILSVYFQVLHLVANDGFSAGDVVNSSVAVMELLQVLAGEVPALNVLAPLFESARVAFLMAGGTTQQAAISRQTKVNALCSETPSPCVVSVELQVVRGNASCADVELASRELEDIAAQTSDGLQAFALNSCRCQSHNSSSTAHLIMRSLMHAVDSPDRSTLALVVARTGELFPRSALETQLLALQMVLRAAKDPVGELTVFGEAVLFLLVGDATERIQLLNRCWHSFRITFKVLVLDLLKDTGSLVEQLRQLTGLSEGTIAAFLGAKFTTSQVYDLTPLMMQSASQMCNEETLTLLLKFPEGTSGNVSRDLCSMSPLASIKMVITLLEHINIRNVIYKSPGARQARSTNTPSLSKLSKTFCAGTTQRMLADVRMANLPTPLPSSSLSPEDFKAKYNIPYGTSPYCLDVYTDIIHGKNGEVIWRFLKPLMLGKILYTPRSAATELLIRTANSTFQKMGELSSYAQEWLDAMGNQNANLQIQQLAILKNALANPFVQGFIRSQMNINMTSFMQNLKSFEELGVQLTDTTMDNLKTLSTLMVNISSCVELNRFVPSDSVEELNKRAVGLNKENNLMASVIFHLPEAQNRSRRAVSNLPLATHLNYTLRLSIQNVMRTDYLRDLVWVPGPHTNQNYMYYTHAFLPIQDMLERAAISLYIGRDVSEPALQVQPMPYPCYTDDLFLHSVGLMFPILFMIAWILTIASTVKFLVQEKELCQQEHLAPRPPQYMNIMGVWPASHFLSWLLQSCALLLLMVILLTVILKASGTLPSTNWALLLALFLCFGISVLAMGYMLSACFTHTNVASLTACFIYLLSFFPFLALSSLTLTLTRWQKSLICLLSPTAFSYASQLMGHFEDQGIGAQWSNMYQSPLYGDDISFAYLCWMLIIDTAIYFIVGWYIRNVYPGTYGLARPFYFLFTVSYWQQVCCCGSRRRPMGYLARNMAHESPADSTKDAKDGSMRPQLEAVPAGLTAGVSLRSLTKQYSKGKKAALQDLSLDFYEDQITTLLGHNGAGKTTTMSLLMGLYEPSSGSVHVGGRDARTDMAEVRRQLGVCLQRDVLFPALNVHEHLLLYGRLKALGWSRQRLQQEVDTFLNDLGLYNHKDKLVGTLSGGMKRKLSIAIAFIGGSTTVILDEPTSGVDPCSRRSIWNLILKHRAGRTIILSTHHLDEAEVLSDRIAVLEHGKLRCCGSPQYLKEIYGQGLTLTLTKKSGALGSRSPFDPERVVSLVRSGVEGAVLKSGEDSSGNRNADMVFLLPAHSQNVLGQSFLAILEENMEELGLSGYAISDTTLEEVFLKLVQEAEDQSLKDITNKFPEAESSSINSETAAPPDHTSPAASDTSDTVSLESEGSSQDSFEKHLVKKERVTGIHLLVHKTQALIYKRFHHWRRDVKGAAAQIVLPVILVALAMAFASMEPGVPEYPSLHLQPSLYSSASFFSLHNSSSASASSLTSTLMKHAACLDQPPSRNNSCWANRPPTSWFPSAKGDESSCSCTSCKELCSAVQDMPSYTNVNPQLQMFNLSGYDVEEYLIGTTCQYLLKRYGGWSFGLPHTASSDLEVVPDNRTLTKVWYNPEGYHALPAYVNSLNNLLLWDNLPEGEHPGDYRISVNSKPYAGQQLSQDMILQNLGDTGVAICILLGFSIITGSFATAVVRERITGSKRLQQISGVSPTFYWAVNFAYDMLSYSVTTGLCIAVIAAFHLPAYTDNSNLGAVSLLLILFGFASLPWMYLLSGIFSEEEMAFVTYISINIILGVTTIISTFLVNFLYLNSDSESLYNAYNVMRWLFLVFPQFCLGWGLVSLSKQRLMEDIMTLLGSDPQESSSFAMDITGWPFVALAVNGLVCFTLRLVLTDELIWKLRRRWQRQAVEPGQPELDTDVQAERSRVEDAATPDDALQLVGLRKRYRLLSRSFTAVDGLHLGVSPNQCFGLLGVNGAGKTTTFKMLTGDIQPSGGDAIIRTQNGAFLKMDKARRTGTLIGYCPQFDALDDLLTGWEHLYCYARIRGIPSHHIEQVSQELVTRLHLSLHVDKLVKTYSGGTKRKLSTALALIGKPQLLLLDEPSSGMDPKSKRYLWKTITREVRQGCSVVLTSHSMEECEALCDKLAIMVNGQFKCLGTLQHLKNRFGNGHMIKLRLSSGNSKVTEVTEFITSHFPGAYLKEQHISQLEFQVPSNAAKLSEIFIALEKEKESLSIQHYSISQTTLDQVFINFARQQIDMEEESSNADARPPVPTV